MWSTAPVIFTSMPHPLSTARLTLSPQQPGDAPWLAELFTARGDGHVGIEAAGVRIETMTRTLASTGIGALVMRPTDGSPPVGYVALIVGRSSLDQPEIAYEVPPAAQGRGYTTEAAAALVQAAWATRRSRLWLTTRSWNVASLRVAAKLGFTHHHTGTGDEHDVQWLTLHRPPGQGGST